MKRKRTDRTGPDQTTAPLNFPPPNWFPALTLKSDFSRQSLAGLFACLPVFPRLPRRERCASKLKSPACLVGLDFDQYEGRLLLLLPRSTTHLSPRAPATAAGAAGAASQGECRLRFSEAQYPVHARFPPFPALPSSICFVSHSEAPRFMYESTKLPLVRLRLHFAF